LLYQLILALVASGPLFPFVTRALFRSFALLRLGAAADWHSTALEVVAMVGTAMGTGLAVGAPIAAVSLLTDVFVGLVGRAAPHMGAQALGAPSRILVGGAVLWLTVGLLSDKLLDLAAQTPATIHTLLAR
jgi:flagellar biosynthesis protein FliR